MRLAMTADDLSTHVSCSFLLAWKLKSMYKQTSLPSPPTSQTSDDRGLILHKAVSVTKNVSTRGEASPSNMNLDVPMQGYSTSSLGMILSFHFHQPFSCLSAVPQSGTGSHTKMVDGCIPPPPSFLLFSLLYHSSSPLYYDQLSCSSASVYDTTSCAWSSQHHHAPNDHSLSLSLSLLMLWGRCSTSQCEPQVSFKAGIWYSSGGHRVSLYLGPRGRPCLSLPLSSSCSFLWPRALTCWCQQHDSHHSWPEAVRLR